MFTQLSTVYTPATFPWHLAMFRTPHSIQTWLRQIYTSSSPDVYDCKDATPHTMHNVICHLAAVTKHDAIANGNVHVRECLKKMLLVHGQWLAHSYPHTCMCTHTQHTDTHTNTTLTHTPAAALVTLWSRGDWRC